MTLTEAAEVWLEQKAIIKAAEAKLKAPADQLKVHFRKTGRPTFRGVRWSVSTSMALNTAAVRVELADRIEEFLEVRERETLSVVGVGP